MENLLQKRHIGKTNRILLFILDRAENWTKATIKNVWTPKDPTLLSFIALSIFLLPAYKPSKVSINPSVCIPPVIKKPETRHRQTEDWFDHELFFSNKYIKLCREPIIRPRKGANWAIFLNFGLINGNLGKIV